MNELFQHSWPEDLPEECPKCANTFTIRRNLSIGIGMAGRFFRRMAYWFLIPWIFISFFVIALRMAHRVFSHSENPDLLTVILIFVVPCLLFVPLCLFMPDSRRVRCRHCDFDHDYPCSDPGTTSPPPPSPPA